MLFCLRSPPVNPATGKALALPIFNPVDKHGRVFFLAWTSFLFSFLAWYAMPPLLNRTIRIDLALTHTEILISNIVALVAGLLTRLVAGPLCDLYGPRYVLVGILWAAAIPTGLAGTVTGPGGLYVIRFFIGICGAAFVPANIWVVSWYDEHVVGTATAFAAGWGDAGVGVTFFVMPAVFDSLMSNHNLTETVAWRVSFIVPCLCLLFFGGCVLTLAEDTPLGPWPGRRTITPTSTIGNLASYPSSVAEKPSRKSSTASIFAYISPASRRPSAADTEGSYTVGPTSRAGSVAPTLVNPPTFGENFKDVMCPQTLLLSGLYFCTFGGGLALSSLLVSWYLDKFNWDQTQAGSWAAMFGLLNIITRPSGGMIADVLANCVGDGRQMHVKKYWACALCVMQGVFCLWVGLLNPSSATTLLGGVAGIAIFMQAANGAIYSLVPLVNPHVRGLMGGVVGGAGNLGGIVFCTISRFSHHNETIWIVGCAGVVAGSLLVLIPPIPVKQREQAAPQSKSEIP